MAKSVVLRSGSVSFQMAKEHASGSTFLASILNGEAGDINVSGDFITINLKVIEK